MPTVTVRNLPEPVLRRLRERAARAHRSLEEEVRRILQRAADHDRDDFLRWVDAHAVDVGDVDVVELIRADRER